GAVLLFLCFAALPAIAQDAAPPASAPAAAAPAAPAAAAPAADAAAAPAAAPAPKLDSGDTAWMLSSVALVLLMTIPGLALFYGGMVRRKNVIATVAQSFDITCVVTIVWSVFSYSIACGTNPDPEQNKYGGGLGNVMLKSVTMDKPYSIAGSPVTIP